MVVNVNTIIQYWLIFTRVTLSLNTDVHQQDPEGRKSAMQGSLITITCLSNRVTLVKINQYCIIILTLTTT